MKWHRKSIHTFTYMHCTNNCRKLTQKLSSTPQHTDWKIDFILPYCWRYRHIVLNDTRRRSYMLSRYELGRRQLWDNPIYYRSIALEKLTEIMIVSKTAEIRTGYFRIQFQSVTATLICSVCARACNCCSSLVIFSRFNYCSSTA
jgi:hypothetical protein